MSATPFLIVSGICMLLAALSSTRFAILINRQNNTSDVKISSEIKISFCFLAAYFVVNFLAEMIAWYYSYIPTPNGFIYSISLMTLAAFLFLFFYFQNRNTGLGLFMASVYSLFSFLFFYNTLWRPGISMSFTYVLLYYSLLAIISAIFLAISLMSHSRLPNYANIRIGILFFIYHFFASFITVFCIEVEANRLLYPNLFFINISFGILFYLSAALLIFKMKKSSYYDR